MSVCRMYKENRRLAQCRRVPRILGRGAEEIVRFSARANFSDHTHCALFVHGFNTTKMNAKYVQSASIARPSRLGGRSGRQREGRATPNWVGGGVPEPLRGPPPPPPPPLIRPCNECIDSQLRLKRNYIRRKVRNRLFQ